MQDQHFSLMEFTLVSKHSESMLKVEFFLGACCTCEWAEIRHLLTKVEPWGGHQACDGLLGGSVWAGDNGHNLGLNRALCTALEPVQSLCDAACANLGQ